MKVLSIERWIVLLFSFFFFSINIWHHVHSGPPSWDEAWYLETSFRLFYALKESVWLFIREYVHAFGDRPPLIAVLPIPIYFLLGAGEKVGLLVNDVGLLLAGWSVYQIGKRLYGEVAGLGAVVSLWLMPLVYGLSRVYLVECWLMTLTCLTYWQLLEAKAKGRGYGIRLGLLLGLGMLVKPVFPLYVLGGAIVGWRVLVREWLYVFGVGLLVAMSWYVFNFEGMFNHVMSASRGSLSHYYGQSSSIISVSTLRDYEEIIREGLSWRTVVGGGVLVLVSLMRGQFKSIRWSWKEWYWGLWFLIPFIICLFIYNRESRFLAAALPPLAIGMGAVGAMILRKKKMGWFSGILFGLFFLLPLSTYTTQTFGFPGGPPYKFNGPPAILGQWDRLAVLEAILQDSEGHPVSAITNFNYPTFNYNNLTSLAYQKRYPIHLYGFESMTKIEDVLNFIRSYQIQYVVLVKGSLPWNLNPIINGLRLPLQEFFESDKAPVRKIGHVSLRPDVEASIYRILDAKK